MVDVARFFLEFVQEESCGKCTPCRVGTKRMLEIVTRITEGKGEMADLDKLVELGQQIRETSLCGLGQTAPNPVLSTLRHFREEYVAHIRDKKCPAGVCADLTRAPCMTACPAGVYVPGYVSLIGEARYAEAMRVHRENNPLAAVCARVCFHACEDKCRRSGLDESVAIRGLKRFMADQETTWQLPEIRISDEAAKRKVAIVGAGPSGLACGYFLARLGYRPTIFESEPRAGGMLVQAIPAYRLPRDIVDREVSMIERIGVELRYGQRLGRDFTLPDLRGRGYEAVFLGVGAPSGQRLGVPGDEAEGVVEALDYLREFNLRGTASKGEHVLVIGGGNAAVDAARTAVRLGAQNVTLLYRRTREEMPAYAEEVEEAEREGVRMKFLVAPVEVLTQNGRVCGVRAQQMSLGAFDRSGRRRPVATPGGEFVIEGDLVIAAVGQTLNPSFLGVNGDLRLRDNHFIVADPTTGRTTIPWLFAGGDAVVGPSSVAEAVGGGERAAAGIDRIFTGKDNAFWRIRARVDTAFDPDADPILVPRAPIRTLPAEQRTHNFREVEQPWTETEALREARRCLRCDYRCA